MLKKYLKFITPIVIPMIVVLTIYYHQNLYPFSDNAIIQVDADYQYVAILYRIYDFLHGNASIIYDNIGLGNNIYISMIIQGSIFSPVNLLLYFTPRDNIINYFNIILLTKITLTCLTSYIYINKRHNKIPEFYKILLSLLYSFNGFILLNYYNIMWLDCVILFPLIVLFLEKLLDNNKNIGYIIVLTISLIISFYISYFILFFIVFYSFLYLEPNYSKEEIKSKVTLLGLSTIIAVMISSFSTLPAIYQLVNSSRFVSKNEYTLNSLFMLKSLHVLVSPILITFFICFLTKGKKNFKEKYIILFTLFLLGIGIILEPINLSIHGGSYWCFPYRYGFITSFILLKGSLYYIENKCSSNNTTEPDLKILNIIIFITLFILTILFNNDLLTKINDEMIFFEIKDPQIYFCLIRICIFLIIMTLISITFNKRKINYLLLTTTTILSIIVFSSWTMYYNSTYYLTKSANDINNNMNLPKDGNYKIDYTGYNPDYGFILDVSTLDNWLHVIPNGEKETYNKLGYYIDQTTVSSYGGTIFSDYILKTKYIISDHEKNEEIYEKISEYNKKYLYKYKYNISSGIIYQDNSSIEYTNSFDYQNKIYKKLYNTDDNIIKIDNYTEEENIITINYHPKELGILYFQAEDYDSINYIEIANKVFFLKGRYILDLGVYDQDVEITINKNNDHQFNFSLGFIKYTDIKNLSSQVEYKNNTYYVSNVTNDNNYLFLPINYIPGIKTYVNNEEVRTNKYLSNFVSIKLNNGNNNITIKYDMPLFKISIIISVIGLISLSIWKRFSYKIFLKNTCYYIYNIIVIAFFIYYYIYSMLKWILKI